MDKRSPPDYGAHGPGPMPGPGAARFIGAVFGFVFAAIGLTVIVFLWSGDPDDFHSPPLFFKVFGSLIAVVFVLAGGTMGVSALRNRGGLAGQPRAQGDPSAAATGSSPAGYKCPHCAAPLGANADVSPSGDVKCAFCGRWFNIHRSG